MRATLGHIASEPPSDDRDGAKRDAAAWLDTIGADTIATLNQSPSQTIVPVHARPSTGGVRALAKLQELGTETQQLRIGEVIGEGGMGVVRVAEQVALGRTVAVKTLKAIRRDPGAALDLLREAWVTGSLEHPNIVPVHSLGLDHDATPSIVLKRIEGVEWSRLMRDLDEVRRRFGGTDLLAWNLAILLQVLNAVRFAHSHGILHRDLKPSNVMIGDFGEVYLLDWGIAVSLRDDGTGRFPLASDATALAGTPCYMAPEMLGAEGSPPLSERTDVYLAGAVLFEIITGKPPHAGTNPIAMVASVIASRPELPSNTAPELARICSRAMEADPTRRFESVDALRLALERYLEHRGSAQLAARAQERLDELLAQLGPSSSSPAREREDIYRLFGACRYGFRDALAVWPENDEARRGLLQATLAIAEYELAGDRPQAAVSLLGELDEPPPLLETARSAAAAQSLRVAELERIGRDHDMQTGTRTRAFLATTFGLIFTIVPLIIAFVPALAAVSHAAHAGWAALFIVLVVAATLWARESMRATAINRRLTAVAMFMFVAQGILAVGAWSLGRPALELFVWNLFTYLVICGSMAIYLDAWLGVATAGYAVGFLVAARAPELALYMTSAGNALFTILAAWRWRPASLRYSDTERALRSKRPDRSG